MGGIQYTFGRVILDSLAHEEEVRLREEQNAMANADAKAGRDLQRAGLNAQMDESEAAAQYRTLTLKLSAKEKEDQDKFRADQLLLQGKGVDASIAHDQAMLKLKREEAKFVTDASKATTEVVDYENSGLPADVKRIYKEQVRLGIMDGSIFTDKMTKAQWATWHGDPKATQARGAMAAALTADGLFKEAKETLDQVTPPAGALPEEWTWGDVWHTLTTDWMFEDKEKNTMAGVMKNNMAQRKEAAQKIALGSEVDTYMLIRGVQSAYEGFAITKNAEDFKPTLEKVGDYIKTLQTLMSNEEVQFSPATVQRLQALIYRHDDMFRLLKAQNEEAAKGFEKLATESLIKAQAKEKDPENRQFLNQYIKE